MSGEIKCRDPNSEILRREVNGRKGRKGMEGLRKEIKQGYSGASAIFLLPRVGGRLVMTRGRIEKAKGRTMNRKRRGREDCRREETVAGEGRMCAEGEKFGGGGGGGGGGNACLP